MPDGFQSMQQQAITQMKAMQSKAAPASEPPKKDVPLPPKEEQKNTQPPKGTAASPVSALPPAPASSQPKPGAHLNGLLSRFLHMENDTALLLPLLLLLGREGADDALLLALLYLMG
ncbi:MAG: hypothetical protein IJU56_02310 [Clostridia bacterium]|nr:hypothetical protein [Clostridia bacterium]